MTAKKRGLGRGLDALLGPKGAAGTPVNVAAVAQPQPGEVLRKIKVSELQPGKYQPRRDMDAGGPGRGGNERSQDTCGRR